jgi:hypothetical protein
MFRNALFVVRLSPLLTAGEKLFLQIWSHDIDIFFFYFVKRSACGNTLQIEIVHTHIWCHVVIYCTISNYVTPRKLIKFIVKLCARNTKFNRIPASSFEYHTDRHVFAFSTDFSLLEIWFTQILVFMMRVKSCRSSRIFVLTLTRTVGGVFRAVFPYPPGRPFLSYPN